jgi:hypothetical protein
MFAAMAICALLIWALTIAAAKELGSTPNHFYGCFVNEQCERSALTAADSGLYLTKWFTILDPTSIAPSLRSPTRRGAPCSLG